MVWLLLGKLEEIFLDEMILSIFNFIRFIQSFYQERLIYNVILDLIY